MLRSRVRLTGFVIVVAAAGMVTGVAVSIRAQGPRLVVSASDFRDTRGTVTLASGAASCGLTWQGRDQAPLGCELVVEPGGALAVKGRLQVGRPRLEGEWRWRVLDLGPLVATLRQSSTPWAERVQRFSRQVADFEAAHAGTIEPMGWSMADPEPAATVAAAESRLGFRLPAGHAALLTRGRPEIGDSFTVPASRLARTATTITREWESPAPRLGADVQALYDASTMLFTEVGDGYGGLVYHPADGACQGQAGFYWIHQDSIARPRLLRTAAGACRTYEQAMVWVIATLGLQAYGDTTPDVAVLDLSAAVAHARLDLDDGRQFRWRLQLDWDRIE